MDNWKYGLMVVRLSDSICSSHPCWTHIMSVAILTVTVRIQSVEGSLVVDDQYVPTF